jgi:quercetin dioxygenase-like cupin family protein
MHAPPPPRRVVVPGDGRSVTLGRGIGVDFRVAGADTGGLLSIVEHPLDPGVLVPPHTHEATDEFSYVVFGRVGARVGDDVIESALPGSYILKPRGVPHTFWNPGPEPALLVEMITPAGFEQFFSEMAELMQDGVPEPEGLGALGAKYGLTFNMDLGWVEELTAKYDLKLNIG